MTAPAVFGQATPQTDQSQYNSLLFQIKQALCKMQTMTLVQVLASTSGGALALAGTVDVQPLVNQRTGNSVGVAHGKLSRLNYLRLGGNGGAVILDPQPGDIGLALFASRDISAVVKAKGRANAGSFRMYDWADGIYVGGVLNAIPTIYLQFFAGITIGAPMANATGNFAVGSGATGSFVSSDGQTVTVQDGIITALT